jgi:DNA polymerase (family 10)
MLQDLHNHSTFSDGANSIEEIVEAASKNFDVIAITDHGRGLPFVAIKESLDEYIHKIRVNDIHFGIRVLAGIEANIDKEGNIDYTEEECKQLQIVIASIHSNFDLSRDLQTARLIRVIENPSVDIIGHPDGGEFPSREPINVGWDKIFNACVKHDVALEINGCDTRVGLSPQQMWQAKQLGVKFTFGSDSHSVLNRQHLIQNCIYRARRGGLEWSDIKTF